MRIGLVIYGSLDTVSGGYLYDRVLVDHFQRSGDQVEIISLPGDNYLRCLAQNFSPKLRKRLSTVQLDILLEDELCHPSLFRHNEWLKGSSRFPLVALVHHLRSSEPRVAWQNHVYRTFERRFLRTIDGFIYNSQTTRRSVQQLSPGKKPSLVAYPASDHLQPIVTPEEIIARAHLPGPVRLLFLGNLIPRKGLHILLRSLNDLPQDKWSLTVVGSLDMNRGYAEKMRSLTKDMGFEHRVQFTGPLLNHALKEHLKTHHVLVLPSTYEGFGIACLEGMSFGMPAIATTAGGAVELITSGKNGYLVPPGDPVELAQKLNLLIGDREHLIELSLKARQRYLAHPTWSETCEHIRNFLINSRFIELEYA